MGLFSSLLFASILSILHRVFSFLICLTILFWLSFLLVGYVFSFMSCHVIMCHLSLVWYGVWCFHSRFLSILSDYPPCFPYMFSLFSTSCLFCSSSAKWPSHSTWHQASSLPACMTGSTLHVPSHYAVEVFFSLIRVDLLRVFELSLDMLHYFCFLLLISSLIVWDFLCPALHFILGSMYRKQSPTSGTSRKILFCSSSWSTRSNFSSVRST
jgi:hypothetical protein